MDNRAIIGSSNVNCLNNVNSFNTTINDDKAQVLQWLSPLEPQKRHQHLRGDRLDGVGRWIFRTSEFNRWNTGEGGSSDSVLFCYGNPGVGKTHLRRQDITVAGLYCDYLDRNEQTTSNMLGAMLKQLVGRGTVPEDIRRAFEDAKEHFGGVGPRVPELLQMLKAAIVQRQWVVICIDGLDEPLAVHRAGLLSALQAIVRGLPNIRLFLTGRPFIRPEVERCFHSAGTILVSPTREDTKAFLRMKLAGDLEPDAMDESLRADIMEIIPKKISEIFLLVSLSIEAILGETTIRRRREKLRQMSSGQDVGGVYTATLERIRAQGEGRARLGMEAIMWIAHSERPLSPDDLCQALGVEIGSADLRSDNIPTIRTILSCGLGLVTVDSSSCKVRLVHFTLQEHIPSNPTLFCNPHSIMAEVCLTYLNFACIRDLFPTLFSPPSTTPFLKYASRYWGAHARRQTSPGVISLALGLFERFDAGTFCKLFLEEEFGRVGVPRVYCGDKCTALHAGSYLGVLEIMVSLLEINKWDLNATDLFGRTALVCAVKAEHDPIAKVLLEQGGADPNTLDCGGRTLLSWAAEGGQEGIAAMLLERRDVNPDAASEGGRTPLSLAADPETERRGTEGGRVRVVEMLLERNEVNPDSPDEDGRTPLSWVAGSVLFAQDIGEEDEEEGEGEGDARKEESIQIAKMLLERNDVDPDKADKRGRTPLSHAADIGNEEVVRMLLERNCVNPDKADKSGRTPLSRATGERRSKGAVRMLLERNDVNPDKADKRGRTPLSHAASSGNGEVMRMLLERNDVNPDKADKSGLTPLLWAARLGNEEIADMLFQRNDVNPNTVDVSGRTLFLWACWGRCSRFVRVLLELNDVNPNTVDKGGRTPLSWAACRRWNEGVVRMLLERNDVDPNKADKSGRTPLWWAAGLGNEEIADMLFQRNDVNPNTVDLSGRTLFSRACGGGCPRIARALLELNDVNPNTADKSGRTPLSWALSQRNWDFDYRRGTRREVVRILLERNDVNPDTADKSGRTPLSWAVQLPHGDESAKMLLKRNDVNPDSADMSGRTPLSWAAECGREEVVEMLLEWNDVNPDSVDQSGRTPLSWATENGHGKIIQMLLDSRDVHPNTRGRGGRAPFPSGVGSGREEIADLLLDQNNTSHHTASEIGQTLFPPAPMLWGEKIGDMLSEGDNANLKTADESSRTLVLWRTENGCAEVVQGQDGWHDLDAILRLRGELPEPFATNPSPPLEPPFKKFRRF